MTESGETGQGAQLTLKAIAEAHTPHEKSLSYEESKDAYNEDAARQAFGGEFVDRLKKNQKTFTGDWWQLALLVSNLERNNKNPVIEDRYRVADWKAWRRRCGESGVDAYELPHLEHAVLTGVHLEGAELSEAHLEGADLADTHLEQANLMYAYLEYANLVGVHLEHANLTLGNLQHADVKSAHLEHADLSEANLEHARVREAGFDRADVRRAEGLRFDRNRVEGISIEGDAPDPWSVLRRKYTGPWFFVHLLLLGVFFAPYAGHALYLTTQSRYQEWFVEEYNRLEAKLPDVEVLRGYHEELERRFRDELERRPAWWLLLGLHKGWLPFALAMVVIAYNAIRGYLTLRVSTLRDAEERSATTPALTEYYGICHPLSAESAPGIRRILQTWWKAPWELRVFSPTHWVRRARDKWFGSRGTKERPAEDDARSLIDCVGFYRLHLLAKYLLLVALSAVVYNTAEWVLTTEVWVPKAG